MGDDADRGRPVTAPFRRTLRVEYPLAEGRIVLRTSADWTQDIEAEEATDGGHTFTSVALGASIQGSALTESDSEMLLLDVTPLSLGIMIVGGYFHRLIQQNTTVPTPSRSLSSPKTRSSTSSPCCASATRAPGRPAPTGSSS